MTETGRAKLALLDEYGREFPSHHGWFRRPTGYERVELPQHWNFDGRRFTSGREMVFTGVEGTVAATAIIFPDGRMLGGPLDHPVRLERTDVYTIPAGEFRYEP